MTVTTTQFPKSPPTPIFEAFSREVRRIAVTWRAWERLFCVEEDSPHEQAVFDRWPEVWGHIRWSLLCTVVLGVGRLVDRRVMNGRANLTVDAVWDEMRFDGRANLEKAATAAKHHFCKSVDPATLLQLRHRDLAHNDLASMLGHEIADVSIEAIDHAVEWLLLFQWRCESLFEGRIVRYDEPISAVHRDRELDRAVMQEVDDLISRLTADR